MIENRTSNMDLREYEQHKFAIADILRSAATIAPSEREEWQARYRDLFARLAEDRFNLVVVGRFNRGKTSLMNAILATDRLPTGIVPLTSVITTVAYGSEERVVLRYEERILTQQVPLEALPQYITQQGNPGNVRRIRMAEVQLPAEILRRGFYFVDTPGLGSAIAESTRTTEAFLPQADAFLLVTSYESPLSDEEFRFLRAASPSARRIFVVVNKHDTVSLDESRDALAYVRDQLNAAFGQAVPRIFSVSARDGLEAKRSGKAALLAASGIPALEEELVRFLLTEKRAEFLLRMCDRAADLAQDLPRSSEAIGLAERIGALSRRIAQDRQRAPVVSVPSASPTAALPVLQQLKSCEVCGHINESLWEFLRQYQYDLSTRHDEQQRFAEGGGLCSFHTWQFESIASPRGICLSYPVLLDRLAAEFRATACPGSRNVAMSAKIQALLPTQKSCVLCGVRANAESEAIAAVATRFAKNAKRALNSLSAICLPHFAMLSGAIENADTMNKIIARQATIFERLSEDMKRYALKHDAIRRTLASAEEETAAERALSVLAAHRNVDAACRME
jgi:small GTP-binding protein